MIPILLKDISPCDQLQQYVRKYQVFRFIFDEDVTPPVKFHYPRPEHCITFYINDIQTFSYLNSLTIHSYPRCVINGIYTVPIRRYGGNDFLAIKVILQPTVLYQLMKLPIGELTSKFIDAGDVWGIDVLSVCETLKESDDLAKIVILIETFIKKQINKTKVNFLPIDKATEYILNGKNDASIDDLASQSCLCLRQFIRKFEERVGVSAKKFERIIRFDNAYRMKNCNPEYDWLHIAIACGYYDYQHMVKDFLEFTNLTPPLLFELEKKSPESAFGFSYVT